MREGGVKSSLIRGLISSGELRAIQVGGRGLWRIGLPDLEDYIADAYRRTASHIAAGIFWMTRLGLSSRQRAVRTARRGRTSPCENTL